jgi:hypothetical protein
MSERRVDIKKEDHKTAKKEEESDVKEPVKLFRETKSTTDMRVYLHGDYINHFTEVELLHSLLEIGSHADALMQVKPLLRALQIGT